MIEMILIGGAILLLCVSSSKLLYRFGVPTLLIFLLLGMLFGSDGLVGIRFEDFEMTRQLCSAALIFIMFFGGFGTSWKAARPVIGPSLVLSTLGVVLTAAIVGLFSWLLFGGNLLNGLLIGAVVSSTDAASVFAILRSRKLNLKNGLASLLEVESGSNDPFSYMLTVVIATLIAGQGGDSVFLLLFKQISLGLAVGFALAFAAVFLLKRINLEISGLYPILMTAIVLLGYGLCEYFGGNGYLSVYIIGIVTGNSRIAHKRSMVHFFDGVTWIMQILLFFTLGLLSFPSQLPQILVPGILLSLFLLFVARPAAVFLLLAFFKFSVREKLFISWVGLRGAASIVFAIYAVTLGVQPDNDLFHLVFFVALFSVSAQGTLIPFLAKKLKLVETETSVLKTFTDYEEESPHLIELTVTGGHPWLEKTLLNADIPEGIRVVMIRRNDQLVIPDGSTLIEDGDVLVVSGEDLSALDPSSITASPGTP